MMRSKISNSSDGLDFQAGLFAAPRGGPPSSSALAEFSAPPGSDHQPFSGSLPRCAIRMRSRRKMIAPTPTSGPLGIAAVRLRRSIRALHVQARAVDSRAAR